MIQLSIVAAIGGEVWVPVSGGLGAMAPVPGALFGMMPRAEWTTHTVADLGDATVAADEYTLHALQRFRRR
jgi:hypothetical protein